MITTQTLSYRGSKALADELNKENPALQRNTSNHWRTFRKTHWLSEKSAYRLEDYSRWRHPTRPQPGVRRAGVLSVVQDGENPQAEREHGSAVSQVSQGLSNHDLEEHRHPPERQHPASGSRAGLAPITVAVPAAWEICRVLEARLVFDKKSYKYSWHMVLEDGLVPPVAPGDRVLAVDMGEIHPAVIADIEHALVLSCRALRACKQYGNKRRSELASLRDRKKRG